MINVLSNLLYMSCDTKIKKLLESISEEEIEDIEEIEKIIETEEVKEKVWMKYIGPQFVGKCFTGCGSALTVFDYHCAKINQCGPLRVENLRPVCIKCYYSSCLCNIGIKKVYPIEVMGNNNKKEYNDSSPGDDLTYEFYLACYALSS